MLKGVTETDNEIAVLLELEKKRLREGTSLIASENMCSKAVAEMTGSVFSMKYSEGYPGARYYGGTEIIDKLEILC